MAINNNRSSIQVAGMKIPLIIVESFPDGTLGEYNGNTREISLSKECFKDEGLFRSTLIHEAVHCALDLSGANYGMTTKTEEQVVTAVEALVVPAVRLIDKAFLKDSF
tara:strand:- start:772 stop:1095 length:324 start_codon:yes stop_codon:yes gene_type:complete